MTDQSDTRPAASQPPPLPHLRSAPAEAPPLETATAAERALPEPAAGIDEPTTPRADWSLSPGERIVPPPPARDGGRFLLMVAAFAAGLAAIGGGGLLLTSRTADRSVPATPVSAPEPAAKVVNAVRPPVSGVRDALPPSPATNASPPPIETAALPSPSPSATVSAAAPKPTILNAPSAAKAAPAAEPTRPTRSEMPPAAAPKVQPSPRQTARAPYDDPTDERPPRDPRPPSADSRDPVQMRAASVGLHPQLPRDLLARLSPTDLRNADIAIQTALMEAGDGEVFVWPRQRWAEQASYQVRLLRSAERGCRRYIVTVVKEGWSTTAPPMETCEREPVAGPRVARERRPADWDHERNDRYR